MFSIHILNWFPNCDIPLLNKNLIAQKLSVTPLILFNRYQYLGIKYSGCNQSLVIYRRTFNKIFSLIMEVLLRRTCCVWCNTEAPTPPQPLHWRGQHGGGRPLRNRLTLICCILIACLVLAHGPRNRP